MAGKAIKKKKDSSSGEYAIVKVEKERLALVLRENIGPRGLSEWDLDRVHIPAGGGGAWELPTLTGEPKIVPAFEGIIVHHRDSRAYWEQGLDQRAPEPPQCFSDDGFLGHGDPGGACDKCPFAQFGSAARGSRTGQACRQTKMLFVLRPGCLLPCVLSVPPTSLRGARNYFLRLASEMLAFWEVVTRFRLSKTKSRGGIDYARIELDVVRRLEGEALQKVAAYRAELTPRLTSIRSTAHDFADPATEPED